MAAEEEGEINQKTPLNRGTADLTPSFVSLIRKWLPLLPLLSWWFVKNNIKMMRNMMVLRAKTHMRTRTHSQAHKHTHTHTRKRIRTQAHARKHTHTHVRTGYAYTPIHTFLPFLKVS